MARVKYLTREDLAPEYQDLLDDTAINIRRAMMNSPGCARVQSRMMRYIRHESPLDPRLRELAILQVGFSTRCAYEYAHHIEQAHLAGVTDADIAAIAEESAGQDTNLDLLAKATLQAARDLTENIALSDATYAELKKGLDDSCIVELVVAIAFYNATVRVLAGLRMDLEPEYQALLDRYPIPAA
jgi:AhpD family alkylhydroperoxidase